MRCECSLPCTTVTFLGDHRVITNPVAAVACCGQTTERRCSIRQQPVDDLSGHAHQVTRRAVSKSWVDGSARTPSAHPWEPDQSTDKDLRTAPSKGRASDWRR